MRPAVIFDFHGTLSDVSSIHHLLAKRDFDGFYEQSLSCPPIGATVLTAQQTHESGYVNLLFTGMPDRYTAGLAEWLKRHEVPVDLVRMRTKEDGFKKSFIVKRRMYLEIVDLGYYVMRAWEDNPADAALWHHQGVPVSLVPGWNDNLHGDRVDK